MTLPPPPNAIKLPPKKPRVCSAYGNTPYRPAAATNRGHKPCGQILPSAGVPARPANWVQRHAGAATSPAAKSYPALACQRAPRTGSSVTLARPQALRPNPTQRWRASAPRELGPASRWRGHKPCGQIPPSAGVPARLANWVQRHAGAATSPAAKSHPALAYQRTPRIGSSVTLGGWISGSGSGWRWVSGWRTAAGDCISGGDTDSALCPAGHRRGRPEGAGQESPASPPP